MSYHLTTEGNRSIPVQLSESEFNEFILMHLPEKMQKRHYRISRHKIFNYILKFLYMGCQWKMLPIERDETGRPEIHYSQVFRVFQAWLKSDTLIKIFEHSVLTLNEKGLLDLSVTPWRWHNDDGQERGRLLRFQRSQTYVVREGSRLR